MEAVWGEERPKSAAKKTQTYVHRLRHRLGDPERIAREGRGYVLRAERAAVDAARFEDLAGAARSALAAGERDRSRRLFEEALGLRRGPAFAGIADLPALGPEATRLDELRLGVIEERIDVDLRLGPAPGDFSGQQAELAEIEARLRTDRAADEPAAKGAPVTAAQFGEGDAYSDSPVGWAG